jgi:hypothetical protein
VVISGDSTAEAIGTGLVAWAAANPDRAQVSILTLPGCGIVRGGERDVGGWQTVSEGCSEWYDVKLAGLVADLQPDVVVLMTTTWDVLDRRWDGGGRLAPWDPEYRDRIDRDLTTTARTLFEAGVGSVAWVLAPVPLVNPADPGAVQGEPLRHAEIYRIMRSLSVDGAPRIAAIELPEWIGQAGLDRDRSARPDGVHWTPEASTRIANEFLGEQLVLIAAGAGR